MLGQPTTRQLYIQQVLEDAPVGFWPLDDAVGSSFIKDYRPASTLYPGALTGGYTLGQYGPQSGLGGVVFNGSSGYISNSSVSSAVGGLSQATIEGWVYRSASGTAQAFGFSNSINYAFYITWYSNNDIYAIVINTTNASPYTTSYTTAVGWYYLCLVFNASVLTLYVNNTHASLVGYTAPSTLATSANLGSFVIGRDVLNGLYSTGPISMVALYDFALSPARILARWNTMMNVSNARLSGPLGNR